MMAAIVLISHDVHHARMILDKLRPIGHDVWWKRRGWDGLLLAHRVQPDLIVVDCALPQVVDALILLRDLRSVARTRLLLVAPHLLPQHYLKKFAASACIDQPFDAEILVQQVQYLLQAGGCPVGTRAFKRLTLSLPGFVNILRGRWYPPKHDLKRYRL